MDRLYAGQYSLCRRNGNKPSAWNAYLHRSVLPVSWTEIHRYFGGDWELVDNTDQTSPLGILFADVRENAGPDYEDSKHTAFSTNHKDMMISDYSSTYFDYAILERPMFCFAYDKEEYEEKLKLYKKITNVENFSTKLNDELKEELLSIIKE